MSRQTERLKLREMAFANMPLWETWTTTDKVKIETPDFLAEYYNLGDVLPSAPTDPPKIQHHVKTIPRRVRRSMARDLAKRKWKIR